MQQKRINDPDILHILVVDMEAQTYDILQGADIPEIGNTLHARSIKEALECSDNSAFDIILLNDRLPDGTVKDVIPTLLQAPAHPELLVYTRKWDPQEAEEILSSGCWDYIINSGKPYDILNHLKRMIEYRREKSADPLELEEDLHEELRSEGVIGTSQLLQHCVSQMIKAAQSDVNVLITGESGTGKELFANSIHSISSRSQKEFVVVDCAALPQTLVESTLFGHVRGAFTGADKNKPGLIKKADGGTLMLDEVGELSLELQKKFLRVLQEQSFRPVGSNHEIQSNFRLIAATNKNLQELCKKNKFREDLLFRLRTFQIELPPLRKRREDITELAYYHRDMKYRSRSTSKKYSTGFLLVLKQYDWPGNVRELFNALDYAFTAAYECDTLYPIHLPTEIRVTATRVALESNQQCFSDKSTGNDLSIDLGLSLQVNRDRAIEHTEMLYLRQLVESTGGDLKECLEISGLSRSRFYALLKKYNISMRGRKA